MQQRTGEKLSASSTIVCAGVAGGLAGMIGNPTEVCFHIFKEGVMINLSCNLGCSSQNVCRWCKAGSTKIYVSKCSKGLGSDRKRRGNGSLYERVGPKCCEEYFNE
jgi:hypothetical protein